MTTLKKLSVILAVITVTLVIYILAGKFEHNDDYLKAYKVYKEKGKSTQFNVNDVKRGFQ